MSTDDPVFFKGLFDKAANFGLVAIPCDLPRAARSAMPSGAPILFIPRAFSRDAQTKLVDDQINQIKEKRGAA